MWLRRAEVRRLLDELRRAKARLTELEAALEAERERSRRREDELVDRVLTASGRHGLTPAPKASAPAEPKARPPLTALDEARLEAYRQAAVASGRPPQDGDRVFEAQRNGQPLPIGLSDEPYILPT